MKKKILKIFGYFLLGNVLFFFTNGIIENIYMTMSINEFKQMAVYEYEEVRDGQTYIYYKVSRETYIDKGWECYERPTIYHDNIGSNGDILLTKESPFEGIPVIHEFITFFFGGHAAIGLGDRNGDDFDFEAKNIIHTLGNGDDNCARVDVNDWLIEERRAETIGVRVKGATKEETNQFICNTLDKLGTPYNYLFIFNTKNTYYCTDIISRSYQEVNKKIKINDWFYTSVNDIVNSNDTYISFYKYMDGKTTYIYYLG